VVRAVGGGDVADDVGERADPVEILRARIGDPGSRCRRRPIGRWSRIAACAAAIDFGRPSGIGVTMPGNSTALRTGMMISASLGRAMLSLELAGAASADRVSTGVSLVFSMLLMGCLDRPWRG
jgi:hypothetical protein